MSYDISLNVDVNGKIYRIVDAGNYTSNIRTMFDEAFGAPDWKFLHGMICKDATPKIGRAIEKMEADPEHYKTFDPPNKWGSYDSALPFLKQFLALCEENPDLTIEIDA